MDERGEGREKKSRESWRQGRRSLSWQQHSRSTTTTREGRSFHLHFHRIFSNALSFLFFSPAGSSGYSHDMLRANVIGCSRDSFRLPRRPAAALATIGSTESSAVEEDSNSSYHRARIAAENCATKLRQCHRHRPRCPMPSVSSHALTEHILNPPCLHLDILDATDQSDRNTPYGVPKQWRSPRVVPWS
ncbi:hypothetical protein BDV12DRAFT_149635 [Aspergillus spectabilis]